MIDFLYGAFYSVIISLMQVLLIKIFLNLKTNRYYAKIVLWIIFGIIISNVFSEKFFLKTFLVVILGIVMTTQSFEGKLSKKISIYLMSYSIAFVSDLFVAMIVFTINKNMDLLSVTNEIDIVALGNLSLLQYFLIVIVLKKIYTKNIEKNLIDKFFTRIAIFYIITIIVCLGIVINFDSNLPVKVKYLFLFITLGLIFFNVIVYIILNDIYFCEIKAKNDRIEIEKNNNLSILYNQIIEKYEEQKKKEHDINKHLAVIMSLIKKNELVELYDYIETYNVKQQCDIIKTGNIILDTIINDSYRKMNRSDIEFIVNIENINSIGISDYDLVTILTNLLDNAIEACKKDINIRRYIKLKIEVLGEKNYIFVVNSYNGILKKYEKGFLTTKEDNEFHGYGLINVEETVKKYGGVFKINVSEKEFNVLICI